MKIPTEKIDLSPRAEFLRPILENWFVVLRRFLDQRGAEKDNAWWYNERASVGTLAAAAWLAGGTALEEYSAIKGEYVGKGKDLEDSFPGRVDIHVTHKRSSWVGEAKHHWVNLSKGKQGGGELETAIDFAETDVKQDKGEAEIRIALVFAVPNMKESESHEQEALVAPWLAMTEDLGLDAIASFYPCFGERNEYKGKYFPGVTLLMKVQSD